MTSLSDGSGTSILRAADGSRRKVGLLGGDRHTLIWAWRRRCLVRRLRARWTP